jgi:hypothetical protein
MAKKTIAERTRTTVETQLAAPRPTPIAGKALNGASCSISQAKETTRRRIGVRAFCTKDRFPLFRRALSAALFGIRCRKPRLNRLAGRRSHAGGDLGPIKPLSAT